MRYQTRSYTCGPASIVNALMLFGRVVPEAVVASLAGTTNAGTSEHGLIKALRKLEYNPAVIKSVRGVRNRVLDGTPVIVHLDEELHWVVIIGCLGKNFIAFDSDPSIYNKQENGVRVIYPSELGTKVFGVSVNRLTSKSK